MFAFATTLASFVVGMLFYEQYFKYPISEATDGELYVAYRSADPTEAAAALDRYIVGMKRLGLEQGSFAVLYETPENDLANVYQQVKSLSESYAEIAKLPVDSLERFKAIEVNRAVIESLPSLSSRLFIASYPWAYGAEVVAGILALIVYLNLALEFSYALRNRAHEIKQKEWQAQSEEKALRVVA